MDEKENKGKNFPYSQTALYLRAIVGGYLAYTGYTLVKGYIDNLNKNKPTSMPVPVLFAMSVLFAVIGVIVFVLSVKKIIKGEYRGGKADISSQSENSVEGTGDTAGKQAVVKEHEKASIADIAAYVNEAEDDEE